MTPEGKGIGHRRRPAQREKDERQQGEGAGQPPEQPREPIAGGTAGCGHGVILVNMVRSSSMIESCRAYITTRASGKRYDGCYELKLRENVPVRRRILTVVAAGVPGAARWMPSDERARALLRRAARPYGIRR